MSASCDRQPYAERVASQCEMFGPRDNDGRLPCYLSRMKKPRGERGSWFAEWDEELFPCVHQYWWTGPNRYNDPFARPTDKKFQELVAAIKQGHRVILTTDTTEDGGHRFDRTGYVAIYDVVNVELDRRASCRERVSSPV